MFVIVSGKKVYDNMLPVIISLKWLCGESSLLVPLPTCSVLEGEGY